MDQKRIGKFILKLRKEKNMTQQELADILNVTDRAISHWENGRSLPDISLFKPLCEVLGISVNELINGERIAEDKLLTKSDEIIINTISDSSVQKKKSRKTMFLLVIIFIIVICGLLYYNTILKVNLVDDSDYLYDLAIDFLRNEELRSNPDASKEDFNTFYSYHGFGIEKKDEYKYVYMWVYNISYFIEEGKTLAISSGSSMPLKFTFKNDKVVNYEYPKDGNEYTSSIKRIFPGIISIQVLNFDKNKNIDKLFNEVSSKKNAYYNYLSLDMSKLSLEDIAYNDLLFTINIGNKDCIPVQLSIYKNAKYKLSTAYRACKKGTTCTMMLSYTKSFSGNYDYDIIQIIKHSVDANNMQFTNDALPQYDILSGNGYHFITDDDNKYLKEFLKSINVDLDKCAEPNYIDY